MPFRRLPNSDPKRFRALQLCKSKADVTLPAERPISLDTFNRLTLLFGQLNTARTERGNALAAQGSATGATRAAQLLLRRTIAHFLNALNRGISRGTLTASVRNLYHLPMNSSRLPELRTEPEVLLWGPRLVAGETRRVADGGAPILFPTIAEVESAYENFATKQLAQGTLSEVMADKEKAVASLRPEIDELILDLWDEIEFAFRRRTAAARRKRAREWGVFYDKRPGEAVENELAAVA
jgi:hypothetical protein